MRAGLLIIYSLLFMAACKDESRIPGNILPQEKMQQVLWDINRADLFVADFLLRKDSTLDRRAESIKLYQEIFQIHHITKEEFQQSFLFYKAHPALFKPVLDSISAHANDVTERLFKPRAITNDTSSRIHRKPSPRRDTISF